MEKTLRFRRLDAPRVVTERRERLHGLEWESCSQRRAVPHYHSATTLGTNSRMRAVRQRPTTLGTILHSLRNRNAQQLHAGFNYMGS
jgi:hypothetical protein